MSKSVDSSYTQSLLDRLMVLHPKSIDLSLNRINRLLAALGHPEKALPAVIHIAGTNGKGSTIAFLRAILETAGYRVQVYTSPHLVAFNERIRLVDGLVHPETLNRALEACETANADAPITFFEITTAAAFFCFADETADILLLETGLGGRLDATNVIDHPVVTGITPVSMDHMQFLGDTLGAIAEEKAGILKPGVPAVFAPQSKDALKKMTRRAQDIGAPLYRYDTEWRIDPHPAGGFMYRGQNWCLDLPGPALAGAHQHINAGMAIACLETLPRLRISEEAIATGLGRVEWCGRLQRLTEGRLVSLLPDEWELWIDGGHNPAAAQALGEVAHTWQDQPLYLVYGMIRSKDLAGFLTPLAPFIASAQAIAVPEEAASFGAGEAARVARHVGIKTDIADDVDMALTRLAKDNSAPARVLICGSLHLVGWVLKANGESLVSAPD